ncbi:MAG: DUF2480 family protein [Balneolales bacterium]
MLNKVKKSKLITLDLQNFYDDTDIVEFDLKDYLYMEFVLKEKDFRSALEEHDWTQYDGKYLAVFCSTDAIIASWAYMLVATHARQHANDVLFGSREDVLHELYRRNMDAVDWSEYENERVLLKGCSNKELPPSVYLLATQKLLPYTDRLMYGEACSFVPVYRKQKVVSKDQ